MEGSGLADLDIGRVALQGLHRIFQGIRIVGEPQLCLQKKVQLGKKILDSTGKKVLKTKLMGFQESNQDGFINENSQLLQRFSDLWV